MARLNCGFGNCDHNKDLICVREEVILDDFGACMSFEVRNIPRLKIYKMRENAVKEGRKMLKYKKD